jgi:tetratricopeptide (TPR) repeat protein
VRSMSNTFLLSIRVASLLWVSSILIIPPLAAQAEEPPMLLAQAKKKPAETGPTPIPLPKFYARHVEEGNKLLAQNRLQEALDEYFAARTINPDYYPTYVGLGKAYIKMGKMAQALDQYRTAVKLLNPAYGTDHIKRGDLLASKGNYKEALDEYWEVLRIDPQAGNQYSLALRHLRYNNDKDAIKALEAAIKMDEDYADPYFQLGNIYYKQNKLPKAIPAYQTAVKLDSKNATYNYFMGNALYKSSRAKKQVNMKEVKASIGYFENALKYGLRRSNIHFNLGTSYILSGDYDKAISNLQECLRMDLRDQEVYYNLGNAFYRRAMQIPFKWDGRSSLTDPQLLRQNDAKFDLLLKSVKSYQAAVAQDKKYAQVYFDMAVSYYRLSELKPTAQFIPKLLDKGTSKDYFSRGMRFFKADMSQKAIESMQQFVALSDNSKMKATANQIITDIKASVSGS